MGLRGWSPRLSPCQGPHCAQRGQDRGIPGLPGQGALGAVDDHPPAAPCPEVGAVQGEGGATPAGAKQGVQVADAGVLGRNRVSGVGG